MTNASTADAIKHEESVHRGAFFIERGGKRVAEMTYIRDDPTTVTIDHTKVDEALAGQGIARRLLDAAVNWARESHTKVAATCSYAAAQFKKDPSLHDVYRTTS